MKMARQTALILTVRDRRILNDLDRVRLLTGQQLERLHFADLATENARGSARRRSLRHLASQGLVATLPRRVGGEHAGSAGLIYTMDARAQRQRGLWDEEGTEPDNRRVRRPWSIGWMFVAHSLDVAELYVRLREGERRKELRIVRFEAEPAAWHATSTGLLKPDAFTVVESDGWERHWWIEVDRSTESLPTLRRKLFGYIQAVRSGAAGPAGVVPIVLITVRDDVRLDNVRSIIAQLTEPAPRLFKAQRFDQTFASPTPQEQARPPP